MTASLSAKEQQEVFDRLVDAVVKGNSFLDFGIFGAKYSFRTLSDGGRTDLVLAMLLQEKQPSYADWIRRGAGTLWEDWKDGSSRNHIMFGDVSAWYYQALAGIRLFGGSPFAVAQNMTCPATGNDAFDKAISDLRAKNPTAFKVFCVAPQCRPADLTVPGRKPLRKVDAKVNSPYGLIASNWQWNEAMTEMTLNVTVPVNTNCIVVLPFGKGTVTPSANVSGPSAISAGQTKYIVGSGFYTFKVKQSLK